MTIKIAVKDPVDTADDNKSAPGEPQASVKLNMRKAIEGQVMIFDHPDIDIVIDPSKRKIIAFPKEMRNDEIYHTQDALFKHLMRAGLIEYDSIKGGNVYGSFEASISESAFEGASSVQLVIFQISKWVDKERPYFEAERAYLEKEEDRLLEPEREDSTELGEVPHEEQKGSIRPGWIRGPFGIYDMYKV